MMAQQDAGVVQEPFKVGAGVDAATECLADLTIVVKAEPELEALRAPTDCDRDVAAAVGEFAAGGHASARHLL